jgi:hypothetical protein
MKKVDNIKLLDEVYATSLQYNDELEFVQPKFDMLPIHGIHNYWKNEELKNPHVCNNTNEIITYMKPIIPAEWVKDLFDTNPDIKARLLELNKVSKYMARAWLAVLIGKNKLRIYNKLDIDDMPLGVCFMGALALTDYYSVFRKVDFTIGNAYDNTIMKALVISYAKNYDVKEFERAINFTLGDGRYAEFWFSKEWNTPTYDSWLDYSVSRSFTGICKSGNDYSINYMGTVYDVFSEKFIKKLPQHRHLDGLYLYLFKNPNKLPEVSDENFFNELNISIKADE